VTTREAIRRVRVRCEELRGAWWGDEFGTQAVETLIRALSRPTRLEREAARLLRSLPFHDAAETRWLAAYERKRKAGR
jgi:hypothetical protein